mgnify:CR=1 FL=1
MNAALPQQATQDTAAWENPMGTDGFEFIEFAAPDPQAMGKVFEGMGFRPVARAQALAMAPLQAAMPTSPRPPMALPSLGMMITFTSRG